MTRPKGRDQREHIFARFYTNQFFCRGTVVSSCPALMLLWAFSPVLSKLAGRGIIIAAECSVTAILSLAEGS